MYNVHIIYLRFSFRFIVTNIKCAITRTVYSESFLECVVIPDFRLQLDYRCYNNISLYSIVYTAPRKVNREDRPIYCAYNTD